MSLRLVAIAGSAVVGTVWEVVNVWRDSALSPARAVILAMGALVLVAVVVLRGRIPVDRATGARGHGAFVPFVALASSIVLWLAILDAILARAAVDVLGLGFGFTVVAFQTVWLAGSAPAVCRRCAQVAAFVGVLLLGLTLIEAILPVHEHVPVPDNPARGDYMMRGSDGRLVGRPGFRGTYRHPEFAGVRVALNGLGFRDDPQDAEPPAAGEMLVVTLGDSMFFGTGVEFRETFYELVEERAEEITPRGLRVVSAAIPGYGPVQYRQMLGRLSRKMTPDVVVVGLFEENDFMDNWSAREVEEARKPPTGSAGVERAPSALGGNPTSNGRRGSKGRRLESFLSRVFTARYWSAWDSRLVASRRWFRSVLVESRLRVLSRSNRFLDVVMQPVLTDEVQRMWDSLFDELSLLRGDCEALGADLLVMVIPGSVQADPGQYRDFVSLQPPEKRVGLSRTSFHDSLVSSLRERGYSVVDTMAVAVSEWEAGRPPYFPEGHWNVHGHEIAADALVKALAK